jgi:hypothetical protein
MVHFEFTVSDTESRRDDTALIETSSQFNDNLSSSVIVNNFESFTNVSPSAENKMQQAAMAIDRLVSGLCECDNLFRNTQGKDPMQTQGLGNRTGSRLATAACSGCASQSIPLFRATSSRHQVH